MPYPQKRRACDRAYVAARGPGHGPQLLLVFSGIIAAVLTTPMKGDMKDPDDSDDGNRDMHVDISEGSPERCCRERFVHESSEEVAFLRPPRVGANVLYGYGVCGRSSLEVCACADLSLCGRLGAWSVSRRLVRSEEAVQSSLCDVGIQPHRLPPFIPRCLGGVPRIVVGTCMLGRQVGVGVLPFGLVAIDPKTGRRSLDHPGTASTCSPAAAHARARAIYLYIYIYKPLR